MTTTPVERESSLNSQVAGEIRAWMGRREMNQADLGRALGENEMWVMRRIRGRQQMTVTDLQRIARVLGITVLELFPSTVRAGDAAINQHSSTVGRSDDPKRVRHLSPRPFGPSRRDRNRPVSAIPATRRRPSPVRPGDRAIAV